VGNVSRYFEKIGIAVVELENTLSVGEKVKFTFQGKDLFSQIVDVIQVNHSKVDSALRGDTVGVVTQEPVPTGAEIFKT
jgi:hypothetical protein